MLHIMCDILGEPRPANEEFRFDALADAMAVLTSDKNVEGVWNNLFSLVSIDARKYRVNAKASPPPLAMYLREAATTVSTQLSYIEAAKQAGARGAAAQRGGTGKPDSERRKAKRQARFEEIKDKKQQKQTAAKQQGPNAAAAATPIAGAPTGAAPTPATGPTAPVKLVALKRTYLVAGSTTRLLDRKGGTEGSMLEMLDRILLDEVLGTPSQEQPCWPIGRAHPTPWRDICCSEPPCWQPFGRPCEKRARAAARLSTVSAWTVEHCETFPTPPGDIAVGLSPIGRAHPTPRSKIRCSEPSSGSRLDVHANHAPGLLLDVQRVVSSEYRVASSEQ